MKQKPSREMSSLMETVDIERDDILAKKPKTGEYTHEMAEATADDGEIKKVVGTAEIDAELPGSESDAVPYSRNFLKNKKTQRMQFWVEYFTTKNRDRFQRFINNGEEYRHHIEEIFEQYGLPKELYFVGLIESGYYLGARSHASAVGPWQFIRATGKRYGMKISPELDERQDLFKATHAAARYFKDLHNMFSSWELALASYNAGENGMVRRIVKYGTHDFYKMSRNKQLPSETINYVPKVLAAMHVVQNAKHYGFEIPKKKYRIYDLTELTPTKKNASLHTIAARMGIDMQLLKKLNPELRKNSTPRYFTGTYMLRVPKSKYAYRLNEDAPVAGVTMINVPKLSKPESRKELNRRTAAVDEEPNTTNTDRPKFHRVRRGETLLSISRKYDITPRKLASANDFKSWKTSLTVGQKINLSPNEEQIVSTRLAAAPKVKITNNPIIYKVVRGDSLTEIARLFNSRISAIKRVNNLKRGIVVGQKIVLPDTQKAIYTVQRGDHLTKVAKSFNLPISTLMKINSMKRRTIYAGQKLIVNMD
ncbi:MAG: LysM peptidoglycan-binding domain-containing protein [Bdellovibrionales bacterium]|nr:LysM peptidoglycan-binding domain-containing protein [Bdellovibrionales bacterium]